MARRTRAAKAKAVTPGHKVGTKRRDMRWEAPDGEIWDSRFEYEVYLGLTAQGLQVSRTGSEASLSYTAPIRNGLCADCGSREVVSEHTYTPDLLVRGPSEDGNGDVVQQAPYFIEAKGYLRSDRRALLRSLRKAHPSVDLRVVVQRDYRATAKRTITEWVIKYLKCPVAIWRPGSSLKWQMP